MKQVISARDIEELMRNGGDARSLPADAIFTPAARDLLNEFQNNGATRSKAQDSGAHGVTRPTNISFKRTP
jgi:hypothetical protein